MMDPTIGDIVMFAGNFAPRGWAFCDGRLLPVNSYAALFSIIGTTYGGDGRSTFALPDLRGRVPVGMGQAAGLPKVQQGQQGGEAAHSLTINEMPLHSHSTEVSAGGSGAAVARTAAGLTGGTAAGQMPSSPVGGSQPHNNMQPYLGVNFIIAIEGSYPDRSDY